MFRRKFSDVWYEHGRNPFPHLKEYWYQQYVKSHPQEFGFSQLDGPFETGADFLAFQDGRQLTVEVERDYLSYRQHEHPIFDVLIVGVLDAPLPSMARFLPPTIKNLDPQKVFDWSNPMRQTFREEMNRRRESLPEQLEWVQENIDSIAAYRIKHGRVQFVPKEVISCECGEQMEEVKPHDWSDQLTEGQMADVMAGFRTFICKGCGIQATER